MTDQFLRRHDQSPSQIRSTQLEKISTCEPFIKPASVEVASSPPSLFRFLTFSLRSFFFSVSMFFGETAYRILTVFKACFDGSRRDHRTHSPFPAARQCPLSVDRLPSFNLPCLFRRTRTVFHS